MSSSGPGDHHDNNFDILRLLAAWFVLFSHCYPLAGAGVPDPLTRLVGNDTFGGVGVAIFFALSGYLVTLSWLRSPEASGFLRRRARRIFPGLAACVLLCALVMGPLLSTLDIGSYFRHPLTLIYLKTASGWWIQYMLPGVFAGNPLPNAVNGSLWSLQYEINCYLLLLMVALLPLGLRWKALVIAAALLVWVAVRPAALMATPFAAHFGLNYYHSKLGLIFAVGAVLACWRDRWVPPWWAGAAGSVIAWMMPASALQTALYSVAIAVFVLGLALHPRWRLRLPTRMGDWSYGVYLYGFPVQQVLSLYGAHQSLGFVGYVLACTALTFVAAALSWHWVERPWLRGRGARSATSSALPTPATPEPARE